MLALAVACGSDSKEEGSGASSRTGPAGGQTAGTATQAAAPIKRGGTLNLVLATTEDLDRCSRTMSPATPSPPTPRGSITMRTSLVPGWEKVDINVDSTQYTFFMRGEVHDGRDGRRGRQVQHGARQNKASVRAADLKTVTEIAVLTSTPSGQR
jgi:hypothetical protein